MMSKSLKKFEIVNFFMTLIKNKNKIEINIVYNFQYKSHRLSYNLPLFKN